LAELTDSILDSVKLGLGGITEEYTAFDTQIMMYINMAFQRLYQLGVGPTDAPFKITDGSETWDEFIDDDSMEMVKADIILRVKLMFDPPGSSYGIEAVKDQIHEYEWLMNVQSESAEAFTEVYSAEETS